VVAVTERVNKTYKPAELEAAVAVLQNNSYHNFEPGDARGIVMALHHKGFRIVCTDAVQRDELSCSKR
jgi:hypothetical protein